MTRIRTHTKRSSTKRRYVIFVSVLIFFILGTKGLSSERVPAAHTFSTYPRHDTQVILNPTVQRHASGSVVHLRRLLDDITQTQTRTSGRFVVVLVVNYAYRILALNFVCNLIRLGVTNYLIFALDRQVFDYLVLQKVNTFLHAEDKISRKKGSINDKQEKEELFGTRAFAETSIRKSILVLKTLNLGYSVILSDADVIWIRNPIPELLGKTEDIVIQSDRSSQERHSPRNYRLNSGLYFARSNLRTISAFRAIVKYARAIRRSEQKAFNYVLCGAFRSHRAGPGSRLGKDKCVYTPRNTTVSVLDLKCFPNGSDTELWTSPRNFSRTHPDVFAIHANYVVGRIEKVKRIQRLGFWFYSEEAETIVSCAFQR